MMSQTGVDVGANHNLQLITNHCNGNKDSPAHEKCRYLLLCVTEGRRKFGDFPNFETRCFQFFLHDNLVILDS